MLEIEAFLTTAMADDLSDESMSSSLDPEQPLKEPMLGVIIVEFLGTIGFVFYCTHVSFVRQTLHIFIYFVDIIVVLIPVLNILSLQGYMGRNCSAVVTVFLFVTEDFALTCFRGYTR